MCRWITDPVVTKSLKSKEAMRIPTEGIGVSCVAIRAAKFIDQLGHNRGYTLFFFGTTRDNKKTLQQQSDTWPYGQEHRIREHECRALKRREVRLHVSTEAERLTL